MASVGYKDRYVIKYKVGEDPVRDVAETIAFLKILLAGNRL